MREIPWYGEVFLIAFITFFIGLPFILVIENNEINLPKSKWECTARDARDNSCVEYGLIEFPKNVEYEK